MDMEIVHRSAILVVDDKKENLLAMQQALATLDADLVLVSSGQEALEHALQRHFAVILLDVQMPIMDGFETAQLLRANHETTSIPIIFITAAYQSECYANQAYDIGVVDYLYKPVDRKTLLSKVNTFLLLEEQRAKLVSLSESLKEANERQALLLEHAGEGIIGINADGLITFLNPRARNLLHAKKSELLHRDICTLFHDVDLKKHLAEWRKGTKAELSVKQQQCSIQKSDGGVLSIELSMSPVLGSKYQLRGGVLLFQDITERKKEEEKLLHEAHHDSLTGLANRILLHEFLSTSVMHEEHKMRRLGVLFLDLDKFKEVNDILGHEAGDQLLQQVAQRLRKCVRYSDLVARLGGDEFVIVLDKIDDNNDASIVAKKIVQSLTQPFHIESRVITTGVSIGIAIYPDVASSSEAMLKAADFAMYQAKEQGGNSFCFYR